MERMTTNKLERFCALWGIRLVRYAPGDGKAQFEFYPLDAPNWESGLAMARALGLSEAEQVAYGIQAGIVHGLGGWGTEALAQYSKKWHDILAS